MAPAVHVRAQITVGGAVARPAHVLCREMQLTAAPGRVAATLGECSLGCLASVSARIEGSLGRVSSERLARRQGKWEMNDSVRGRSLVCALVRFVSKGDLWGRLGQHISVSGAYKSDLIEGSFSGRNLPFLSVVV